MITKHRAALVERPVACSGKGEYIALVYYGSQGGHLHHKVLKYSHRDPRLLGEAHSLQGIARMVPARYRPYIVAISVIKRCLHPRSPDVAKRDRTPHIERVYSWVVEHDNSVRQTNEEAGHHYLHAAMQGSDLQWVVLPYTAYEIDTLPVKRVVSTNYWRNAFASVGMRGVERRVKLRELTSII